MFLKKGSEEAKWRNRKRQGSHTLNEVSQSWSSRVPKSTINETRKTHRTNGTKSYEPRGERRGLKERKKDNDRGKGYRARKTKRGEVEGGESLNRRLRVSREEVRLYIYFLVDFEYQMLRSG